MPAPRFADAVRNSSSPYKNTFTSPGASFTPSMSTEPGNKHHKAVIRLPHDPRFVYPFAAATGRRVTVQVKSGVEFEGLLHGPVLGTKNVHITLKDARRLKQQDSNGTKATLLKEKDFYETLIIPSQEFVQMKATGIPFGQKDEGPETYHNTVMTRNANAQTNNGLSQSVSMESPSSASSSLDSKYELEEEVIPVRDENDMAGFEGDSRECFFQGGDTHGRGGRGRGGNFGRDLVPWNGGGGEADAVDLEELGTRKLNTNWCQFEANKRSIKNSTFSMDQYTSKIDLSKSKYTEEQATRLAKEIEQDSSRNCRMESLLDDSGINEEEEEEDQLNQTTKGMGSPPPPPVAKPFSWADAVKGGKPQQQQQQQQFWKPIQSIANHRTTKPEDATTKSQLPQKSYTSTLPKRAPRTNTAILEQDNEDKKDSGNECGNPMSYETNKTQDRTQNPPSLSPRTGSTEDSGVVIEDTLKTESCPQAPSSPPRAATAAPKPEARKPASTVVPGISFKDKLKANLKPTVPQSKPKKPSGPVDGGAKTPVRDRGGGDYQISSPVGDPVVQSPRGGAYAGKLITCPASSATRHQVRNNVTAQEHLVTPSMPHEVHRHGPPMPMGPPMPIFYPHKAPPGAVPIMPPPPVIQAAMPPPGYRDMAKEGPPRAAVYGGFGSPLDSSSSVTPSPHGAPQVVEAGDEVARRRTFQLNPLAKSYKPVVSLSSGGSVLQNPEYYANPPRVNSAPGESGVKGRDGSMVDAPAQPEHSSSASVGGESGPMSAEFAASQGLAPQPPFIPPNVVTPWPSFPGTGVWHSGLGTPRPGAPGFIPPGMPGPYPVFIPGVSPFMGSMQEPMWRPPPPGHPQMHGMPDQQSLAMMWTNYYSQLVPPNKRMWNSGKGPPGTAPMMRQGRNSRRPPPPMTGQNSVEMQ